MTELTIGALAMEALAPAPAHLRVGAVAAEAIMPLEDTLYIGALALEALTDATPDEPPSGGDEHPWMLAG